MGTFPLSYIRVPPPPRDFLEAFIINPDLISFSGRIISQFSFLINSHANKVIKVILPFLKLELSGQ